MFTDSFNKHFVCDGDSISTEIDGITYVATIIHDDSLRSPEERQEGFWPSLDPKSPGYLGERATEEDLKEATKEAEDILKAYKEEKWWYAGVRISAYKLIRIPGGIFKANFDGYSASLWGIEANYPRGEEIYGSDNSYLTQVANELLPEAIATVKEIMKQLCDNNN